MTTLQSRLQNELIGEPDIAEYTDDTTWGDTYMRHEDVVYGRNDLREEQQNKLSKTAATIASDLKHEIFDELRHEDDCPFYKGKSCICILADVLAALDRYCGLTKDG